ncbi:MAG: IclR family transcriptional regulator [Nocardioides sp.]|uniref:IclR family transcriptional regulator n=1 Tax=Nocardioides sp. TaxID=35761 RepID=UPI0039E59850
MTSSGPTPSKSIQSVDRAARILALLASGPRRLGVAEIADRLELARPTVHGLLQTLRSHGFVEKDRDSDKYQLGPGLLHLGASYLDVSDLRGRSVAFAEHLAARVSAAVRVGILQGGQVLVVHHVFRPGSAFQVSEVGLEMPAHATALGKAIIAFGPPELLADLTAAPLPKLTRSSKDLTGFRREIDRVRREVVAFESDEAVIGESSVAAPVLDRGGVAVGAIGVVGESSRLFADHPEREVASAVLEAAAGLSRELGGRLPPRG